MERPSSNMGQAGELSQKSTEGTGRNPQERLAQLGGITNRVIKEPHHQGEGAESLRPFCNFCREFQSPCQASATIDPALRGIFRRSY